jgi:hypothetical protein
MFKIEGFFGGKKRAADERMQGDPALVEEFKQRISTLEPGASAKDLEMAANAAAIKYGAKGEVPDKILVDLYQQRVIARPDHNIAGTIDTQGNVDAHPL